MAEAVRAILALGANLGERRKTLESAVAALRLTEGISKVRLSPFVESAAVTEDGVDLSKPKYVNAVVELQTTLKPKALLKEARRIEDEHGRIRIERWGSRTLDIDIITYGTVFKVSKELTIPHPRAYQRSFVLTPWSLLDPKAVLPGHGSVAALAADAQDEVWVMMP
jgi:hypothetical protein